MGRHNLTILMVDDDPDEFLLVQGALGNRESGIDLRPAEGGEEMMQMTSIDGARSETPTDHLCVAGVPGTLSVHL